MNKINPEQSLENIQMYSEALQMYRGGLNMKSKNKLIEDMVHLMAEQIKLAEALENAGVHIWYVSGKFKEITFDNK